MGLVRTVVGFDERPPDPSRLAARLKERTGVDFVWQGGSVAFPDDSRLSVELEWHAREVYVLAMIRRRGYLEASLIASLIDLGGRYDGPPLPRFVAKRWDERRWWQLVPR